MALALAVAGLAFKERPILRHPPGVAGQDVDIAGLKNTAKVGLV